MRFIDLFHGLGGFHHALSKLEHECVFASDIDQDLRDIYERNFRIKPHGDIKRVLEQDIPAHDILCAGFPCQPWSKAGKQEGFACPNAGDLFVDDVLRIIRFHHPQYVILENVPNLEMHDEGRTWREMKRQLESLGYDVKHKRLSPHNFGIPHNRERMFIVASRHQLDELIWPIPDNQPASIRTVLDENPVDAHPIPLQIKDCIQVWQDFLNHFPLELSLPGFPIWSMEFGATYPYQDTTPCVLGPKGLKAYKGNHGFSLENVSAEDMKNHLPSYAMTNEKKGSNRTLKIRLKI